MGHRANYAILTDGKVELYYSHWGALSIAEDIFWGPASTESFIRSNRPTEDWLDDVYAEGGVALDLDQRRLTYYYTQWPDEADLQGVYESLLTETWRGSGWTTQRALRWQEIAAAVGVDPALVTSIPTGPSVIPYEELGDNLERSFCCAILSVKTDQGWQDRAIDFHLTGFLMNGPELIDRLAGVAGMDELRAAFDRRSQEDRAMTLGDWIDSFCAIDVASRTVRLSVSEYEEESLPFLQHTWADWTILSESGGAFAHFAYTGRQMPEDLVQTPQAPAPDPPQRSYEECVRLIEEHLDGTEATKAANATRHVEIFQQLEKEHGPVEMVPWFFDRVPSSQAGWVDRLKYKLRLKLGMFLRRFS